MKRILLAGLLAFTSVVLQDCLKDKVSHTYTIFEPVYKDKAEVYANIKSNPPKEIQSPGKIFLYGSYIFLNETDKGVHVIDNSDPAHPIEKAFIDIPGNLDIAVKGNILYADLYSDLVAIDISDPMHASLVKILEYVFPERSYSSGFVADNSRIIVDWIKKDTTVALNQSSGIIFYNAVPAANDAYRGAAAAAPIGVSGSLARFAVVNNYLYAVNSHNLLCVSISNSSDPIISNSMNAGWDIETIYPFQNKLFLGSMGGVFIFDISSPDAPLSEGNFVHARACDPVIADGSYAFVTLREGTYCGRTTNELQVLDIRNLQTPTLIRSYPMTSPQGLSKDNSELFICDGPDGLKVYDASDPSNLVLKQHITGIETYDAIALNGNLVVVAKDGLYQYNYYNGGSLVRESRLTVNR